METVFVYTSAGTDLDLPNTKTLEPACGCISTDNGWVTVRKVSVTVQDLDRQVKIYKGKSLILPEFAFDLLLKGGHVQGGYSWQRN